MTADPHPEDDVSRPRRANRYDALLAARRAAAARPDSLAAQLAYGVAAREIGSRQQAIAAFTNAQRLAPRDPYVARCLADALRVGGFVELALATADVARRLTPEAAESYRCVGDALLAVDAPRAADAMFLRALDLRPAYAAAACGRGRVRLFEGDWQAARAAFEDALARDPRCADARYQCALLDLRFGRYEAAFAAFPAIMDAPEQAPRFPYHASGVPLWDGSSCEGRRVVLAYDQGLGNFMMMARFFSRLARGVVIETPPALLGLMRRSFPELGFEPFTQWPYASELDAHLPLTLLPTLLRIREEAALAWTAPYLRVSAAHVERARSLLALAPAVLHVGVVWHGNVRSERERIRRAPLAAWAPLARVPRVQFHSLQYEASPEELASAPIALAPTHALLRDMDDTAAVLSLLDLVISVDTSVVHLAGALGCPTWLADAFLSDARWGTGREDTPWYRTLRIVRQPERGTWDPVFERMADRLADLAAHGSRRE